jgi:hypothetical protein
MLIVERPCTIVFVFAALKTPGHDSQMKNRVRNFTKHIGRVLLAAQVAK